MIENVGTKDSVISNQKDSLKKMGISNPEGESEGKRIVQSLGDWSSENSDDGELNSNEINDTVKIVNGAKDFKGLWQPKTERSLLNSNL